ncbi:MAG: hypothetical protein PHS57_09415 [Alphaproteobacteria bacterium]|nr:hypothetical protein [Alphaproteobacteria bacterium]
MRSQSLVAVAVGFLLLLVACGALWLSNAQIMPSSEKVEMVVPDERLPR